MTLRYRSLAWLKGLNRGPRGASERRTTLKMRWLMLVVGVTACASTDAVLGVGSPEEERVVPDPADGGSDAAPTEDDAGACADCEYFPAACTPDAFCLNGPFDPNMPGGSIDLRAHITVIRGRSVNDVWAAGALGALAHFDGTSWRRSDPGLRETMRALWLRDSEEVAFGTLARIYVRGLDAADPSAPPSVDGWTLHEPSAPPAYTSYSLLQFESAWSAPGSESLWCAVRALEPGKSSGLWRLRRSTSSTFAIDVGVTPAVCKTLPCSQMKGIHGASANELWAVGIAGATVHVTNAESDTPSVRAFDSRTWDALHGVWAASASEAWAVGALGTIRHYTGDPLYWDVVSDVPTTEHLNSVWGSSASDVWAVGDAGVVLHYDGKNWSRVKVAGLGARRPNLNTVWIAGPGHLWIGGQGVILSLGGKP
jgi:hypothetical protein